MLGNPPMKKRLKAQANPFRLGGLAVKATSYAVEMLNISPSPIKA